MRPPERLHPKLKPGDLNFNITTKESSINQGAARAQQPHLPAVFMDLLSLALCA